MFDKQSYLTLKSLVGNILDTPSKGGNISVKDNKNIYIKSSGVDLKKDFKRSDISKVSLKTLKQKNKYKPSMELNFHSFLDKYVLHYHPIYINIYLCSTYTLDLYPIVDYSMPGDDLATLIEEYENSDIIFLKNHGVVIHSNSLETVVNKYHYLKNRFLSILVNNDNFFTPDEFILKDDPEMILTRLAMKGMVKQPEFLTDDDLSLLLKNPNEKYRSDR